jgi:hypothetical protein
MAFLVAAAAYAVAWALVPLLLVLPHELAHALAALAGGARRVDIVVGGEPRRLGFSLPRLSVRMRLLNSPKWVWYGIFRSELERASRWSRIAVAAAGPLTTLALVILYAAFGSATGGFFRWFFFFLAFGGAWAFLVTAAPIRYGRFFGPYEGRVSDGYRIRETLTARPGS